MAKSYSKSEFHQLMEKVEVVDVRVKNYLELTGYDKWARLYATVHRGWTLSSNIAELINAALVSVIPVSEYVYTVHDEEKYFIVCLKKKKCSCHAFQLDEIPCVHVCVVLDSRNLEKGPYYSNIYKPKTVLRTYDLPAYPLPHKDDWVIPKKILDEVVLSPKYKGPPGIPTKKESGKSESDMFGKKSKNCCSSCGLKRHNRRSCRKYNK
ncbi:hypothetical protein BC332_16948 [Capsicum chinense]|nr:hypothetical protein BC332_16948 [Capsicum chinense]